MSTVVLQITAGVGPREARWFVAALGRHFEDLCAELGCEVVDVASHGDEDAPGSVQLTVVADEGALTRLQMETGSHQLTRRSDARGKASRKRWFAGVLLRDALPASRLVELRAADLVVTACRAGGPGGQHVNKVATAVRVLHRPSGISVRAASERSQRANLRRAEARLGELLAARVEGSRAEGAREARAAHYQVERGNAVRTYTMEGDGQLRRVGA